MSNVCVIDIQGYTYHGHLSMSDDIADYRQPFAHRTGASSMAISLPANLTSPFLFPVKSFSRGEVEIPREN